MNGDREAADQLPLAGIKVVELGHVVMGSSCGLVLADLGADVIKVERAPDGDETRRFAGFGAGLFHFFNRNKKSIAVDLKTDEGKEILRKAVAEADVFIENFGPSAVERLGFGYDACAEINPRLIYCSLKGFMPGPYENRPSLDNLVQMMGGLAYMTGPAGRPLRAGASVTDILGSVFGVVGILSALYERRETGKGQKVTSTLYEATAYLVGQHMSCAAVTGTNPPPMPEGENPWAVYDLFSTSDGEQVCIGIINDRHWQRFCRAFELPDLETASEYATNDGRKNHREELLARIEQRMGELDMETAIALCEKAGVPFAPVRKPADLFNDRQMVEGGSLVQSRLPDGRSASLPEIPLRVGEHDFGLRREPPKVGEGGREFLSSLGYSEQEIDTLIERSVIVVTPD